MKTWLLLWCGCFLGLCITIALAFPISSNEKSATASCISRNRATNYPLYSSNPRNILGKFFNFERDVSFREINDDNLRRQQEEIEELRSKLQSKEQRAQEQATSNQQPYETSEENARPDSEIEMERLRTKLEGLQQQLQQRLRSQEEDSSNEADDMNPNVKTKSQKDDDLYLDENIDLGRMIKVEELRAKLRIIEDQLRQPSSPNLDASIDSLDAELREEMMYMGIDALPSPSSRDTNRGTSPSMSYTPLDRSSLPTEVEELQRMVMAYHRFVQHTVDNMEKEKQKSARQAEERLKKKYLPMIADLEKENAELKGNQNRGFRIF